MRSGGPARATAAPFKGKLSVGVDPVGNTLLVSAEGEDLLKLVCDMIDQLDQAARPSGDIRMHHTTGTVSVKALEAALRAFSGNGPVASVERNGRSNDALPSEPSNGISVESGSAVPAVGD